MLCPSDITSPSLILSLPLLWLRHLVTHGTTSNLFHLVCDRTSNFLLSESGSKCNKLPQSPKRCLPMNGPASHHRQKRPLSWRVAVPPSQTMPSPPNRAWLPPLPSPLPMSSSLTNGSTPAKQTRKAAGPRSELELLRESKRELRAVLSSLLFRLCRSCHPSHRSISLLATVVATADISLCHRCSLCCHRLRCRLTAFASPAAFASISVSAAIATFNIFYNEITTHSTANVCALSPAVTTRWSAGNVSMTAMISIIKLYPRCYNGNNYCKWICLFCHHLMCCLPAGEWPRI
jgi:hypothetical protein